MNVSRTPVIVLATALAILHSAGDFQGRPSSRCPCRTPGEPIYYKGLTSDYVYPTDAGLSRVDLENGNLSLTIVALRPPAFRLRTETLVSADLGQSWKKTPWDPPSNLPGSYTSLLKAEAPSDPKVLYKWLPDVGLYLRSEDHGSTWRLPRYSVEGVSKEDFAFRVTHQGFYRLNFRLVTIHPRQPLTVYAAVEAVPWADRVYDEPQFETYELPGLYGSYDGGETWSKFTESLRSLTRLPYGNGVLGISSSDPSVMYGQGTQGLVKSTDGGKRWTAVGEQAELQSRPGRLYGTEKVLASPTDPTSLQVAQIVIDPTDENVVYVLSNKGVYRSEDGGKSWCLLNLGFDVLDAYNSVALNRLKPNELFVGTMFGLFYSQDRGCHFQKIYPPDDAK